MSDEKYVNIFDTSALEEKERQEQIARNAERRNIVHFLREQKLVDPAHANKLDSIEFTKSEDIEVLHNYINSAQRNTDLIHSLINSLPEKGRHSFSEYMEPLEQSSKLISKKLLDTHKEELLKAQTRKENAHIYENLHLEKPSNKQEEDPQTEIYSTIKKVSGAKKSPPQSQLRSSIKLNESGDYAEIEDKPLSSSPPPLPDRIYPIKKLNEQLGADIFTKLPKDMTLDDIKAVYPKLLHDEALPGTFYAMLPEQQKRMYDNVETEQQKRYDIEHVKQNLLSVRRAISKELQNQLESIQTNSPLTHQSFEVESLLNADPVENAKKGNTTLSLRGVEESLNGYITPALQKLVQENRRSLEEQVSNMDGIQSLLRENAKFRAIQNLGFFGCEMQDKEKFVNNVLDSIKSLPESANSFLRDKTFQPRITESLQPLVAKIFGPDVLPKDTSPEMRDLTVDPTKLKDISKQKVFADEASKYIKTFVSLEQLLNETSLNLGPKQKNEIFPKILPRLVEIKHDSSEFSATATRNINSYILTQQALEKSGLTTDQREKVTNTLLPSLMKLDLEKLNPSDREELANYTAEKLKSHSTLISALRSNDQRIATAELEKIIPKIEQKYKELENPVIGQIIEKSGLKLDSHQREKITNHLLDEVNSARDIINSPEQVVDFVAGKLKASSKSLLSDKIKTKTLAEIKQSISKKFNTKSVDANDQSDYYSSVTDSSTVSMSRQGSILSNDSSLGRRDSVISRSSTASTIHTDSMEGFEQTIKNAGYVISNTARNKSKGDKRMTVPDTEQNPPKEALTKQKPLSGPPSFPPPTGPPPGSTPNSKKALEAKKLVPEQQQGGSITEAKPSAPPKPPRHMKRTLKDANPKQSAHPGPAEQPTKQNEGPTPADKETAVIGRSTTVKSEPQQSEQLIQPDTKPSSVKEKIAFLNKLAAEAQKEIEEARSKKGAHTKTSSETPHRFTKPVQSHNTGPLNSR